MKVVVSYPTGADDWQESELCFPDATERLSERLLTCCCGFVGWAVIIREGRYGCPDCGRRYAGEYRLVMRAGKRASLI